ncbi:c-type cytochrome [Permianibacter aggregans]|uniref:Cytochrome c n=1 Tax=Permianibacter aggregans TaxID=1510150 RepID=A0A4R6UE29_9GAMM|nr:cytochrome c [Permianibacter aggregans]QGX38181.1 c-type cytochrome [Permianibacter aggregans]TDQ44971.1 cytochrome c [Permianibacter aggregans]
MKTLLLTLGLFSVAGLGVHPAISAEISGAEVVNNNCARCHNSRPVHEFSLAEWAVILPHMREKAHLTAQETDAVLQFFQTVGQPRAVGTTSTSPSVPLSGSELMTRYGCQGCHQFNGVGGVVGPSLDRIVADKGEPFVRQKIVNPQFNNPASAMPRMPMTEAEVDAILALLKQAKP